ncbi:MAG: 16S rRNA (uracil(1498)-N(3))-methyltransferase [Phycisphaerae bacterium]|nr:16S rRNA (uracil(1498)-N(3))-methyltransferase [Phycisphaerae bacterium]
MTDEKKTHRFYLPELAGGAQSLPADQAHHALHVLRLGVGAAVELFDGRGNFAAGEIVQVSRAEVEVAAGELHSSPAGRLRVHLAFAVPKGKRLDWLLEKATELAAASLTPIIFARSVAGGENLKLSDGKRNRWVSHCIAAARQCGLNTLPELLPPVKLADYLATASKGPRFFGDIDAAAQSIAEAIPAAGGEFTFIVGPEGGFTASERDAMLAAKAQPVRLGKTTLRIETAAIALLAAAAFDS